MAADKDYTGPWWGGWKERVVEVWTAWGAWFEAAGESERSDARVVLVTCAAAVVGFCVVGVVSVWFNGVGVAVLGLLCLLCIPLALRWLAWLVADVRRDPPDRDE